MQPKWTRRLGLAALFGAVVWASAGCAQERDPINQVQPNALSKHFFVGASLSDSSDDPEFYMRNTVIDVPYGNGGGDGLFTASYAQPLTRIKWEITENDLIARETYERIQDSDHNGTKTSNNGQVVAMFAISSHFDIRRSYNPSTGEELNVVTENTTDRPWNEREYMRVDWSKNLVTDGYEVDTLSQLGIFGGVKWDPMSYYESDPTSPNAPVFDQADGYFDITSKAFASPQTINTPWGAFPACFLPYAYGGNYPVGNCNPTEVTLRLSFKKVVDDDYEASDWDGNKMEAFGWFTQDRYGFERNYGTILDQKWHRYAAKYNIWQKSHIEGSQCAVDYWRDDKGNVAKYKVNEDGTFATDGQTGLPIPDPNGQPFPGTPVGADPHRKSSTDNYTEAECAFTDANGDMTHPGSRCDETAHKCTLPLHERTLRTIPWYYGPGAAPDLFASTRVALDQWNVAVKRAAEIGSKADADQVGADDSGFVTDENDLATRSNGGETIPDVFVLCHNPVIDSDDPACGPPGLLARIGDLRYNMVNIITAPQTHSPWGIMVDADDPTTGEKVSTSVNEWGYVLDFVAQWTGDLLRWINGEISDKDIAGGSYLQDWVKASKLGTSGYQPKTLSHDEILKRIHSTSAEFASANGLTKADAMLPKAMQREKAAKTLQKVLGPSLDSNFESIRKAAIDTDLETKMVTPDMLQAAGMDPSTPLAGNDDAVNKASFLRGMNPQLRAWMKRMREKSFAQRGYCEVEQPEPDSLVGLARQAQKLFPLPDTSDPNYPALKHQRDESLRKWIREQFHVAVIAHEMGHSMGLRHNFTGSIDSLNYHKQYWQLRTRNGAEKPCQDVMTPNTDGTKCAGPRWMDPVTEQEVNGMIWKWGSTTVMDYPGDQTQDMNDIGNYDKAAMRFAYGDVVDVDTDAAQSNDKGKAYLQVLDGFGGIGGQSLGGVHYTWYNEYYHILNNCGPQSDPNDPLSAKCDGFKMEYVPFRMMKTVDKYTPAVTAVRPDLVANFAVAPDGNVRHPYMFGSDEFADIGNVPVYRFDAGADAYEQIQFIISTYENRYVFDNFRRDRVTFNSQSVMSRSADRYFDKLSQMTRTLALMVQFSSNPVQAESNPGDLMPLTLGAQDAFATFLRVLTRPEPGPYAIQKAAQTGMPFDYAEGEDINNLINFPEGDFKVGFGSGEGRYLHNDYDYTQGYWWGDYQTQAGTWYEKLYAAFYLTEAYNNFVSNSKEDYIDGRYKNLNFASLYPNQVRRFFSEVMAGDPMTLGPYVTLPTGNLASTVPEVRYLPWDKWDPNDPTTTKLDYPAGATVLSPLLGWEQQYPLMFLVDWFGATQLNSNTTDQLRIWSPGGADTVDVPLAEQIRFRDPLSGDIFAARNYGTEVVNSKMAPVQTTMGARMIQYANQLAAAAYTQTGTMTDDNGFTHPVYNTATPKDYTKEAQLKGYVSNLNAARELAKFFSSGIYY